MEKRSIKNEGKLFKSCRKDQEKMRENYLLSHKEKIDKKNWRKNIHEEKIDKTKNEGKIFYPRINDWEINDEKTFIKWRINIPERFEGILIFDWWRTPTKK